MHGWAWKAPQLNKQTPNRMQLKTACSHTMHSHAEKRDFYDHDGEAGK